MVKENSEPLQIADEQLGNAVGGTRLNACVDANEPVAVEADADEDIALTSTWAVRCPNCLRTLRNCTCAR